MNRGDLVQVTWTDIQESVTGSPDEAEVLIRNSVGYYWDEVTRNQQPLLITTTTIDSGDPSDFGWCAYPQACVLALKVIKKAKRNGHQPNRTNQEPRAQRPSRRRTSLPVEGSPAGQRQGGSSSGAADPRDGRSSEEPGGSYGSLPSVG